MHGYPWEPMSYRGGVIKRVLLPFRRVYSGDISSIDLEF